MLLLLFRLIGWSADVGEFGFVSLIIYYSTYLDLLQHNNLISPKLQQLCTTFMHDHRQQTLLYVVLEYVLVSCTVVELLE